MEKQYPYPASPRNSSLLKAIVFLLGAVYLLNCLTPLRIHVDMLRYFAIKDCIEFGCDPGSLAAKDYLPYGYTALLLALSKIGLLKSYSIVLINCAYLFGALYMIIKMFEWTVRPLLFVIIVLLSWAIIKFVTHPLSEIQYLFFSTTSLYFFYRFTRTSNFILLFVAFMAAVLAFLTRSAGISIVGALSLALIWHYRKELNILIKKYKIIVVLAILGMVGIIIFSKQLGLNHYAKDFTNQFDEGVGFGQIIKWHFTEWAELTFNISIAKFYQYVSPATAVILFVTAGVIAFGTFVYVLFFRKNNVLPVIKFYVVTYSLIMFTWPYYDPRFWVPLVPLIAAIGVKAYGRFKELRTVRVILYLYIAFYAVAGVASIVFITGTSLNREKLAKTQANGVYRNEYETFFFKKPQSDTAKNINAATVSVLERYDK